MAEKWVVMIADGPQGPSILYSDGTTEPVPGEDLEGDVPSSGVTLPVHR